MRLSIIVPIYNGEDYIENCVKSLINQTEMIDEIILVNDHSADNTVNICNSLSKRYSNIRVLHSEGRGVSAARNRGLKVATGEIIGFCDADDVVSRHMCEIVKKNFKDFKNAKILIVGYEKANDGIIKKRYAVNSIKQWKKDTTIKHVIYDENITGMVCNKFFKAELIADEYFDISLDYSEDMEFVIRMLLKCNDDEIVITNYITYCYIYRENSATNDIARLFNPISGDLKYNETFFKILSLLTDKSIIKYYVLYKIFIFSLSAISTYEVTERSKTVLLDHLKDYFKYFIMLFVIDPCFNLRLLVKLIFRIKNKKVFRW